MHQTILKNIGGDLYKKTSERILAFGGCNYCKTNLKYNTIQAYENIIKKHIEPKTGVPAKVLPSTSPANAKIGFEELAEEYKIILEYLE